MADKEETEEKKSEETETEKAVSRSEFNSLKKDIGTLVKAIVTGFNKVGVIVKATDGAEDENDPDKKKPSDVDKAEDEETDDTKKSEETEDETKKADEETEDETKKSEDETEEEKKSSKKSAKKTSKEDEDYDLEHVTRAIKTLDGLRKKMKKDEEEETEAEKAEDTEEDDTKKAEDDEDTDTKKTEDEEETEATKAAHPLDLFVARVTKTMEDVVARLEKSGKRVPGFESEFISKQIVNNPEVQQYIQKMMKVPGQKKSVAMGNIPFMITKDGKRIALTTPSEQVEKSEQPKDFRSLYKQRYSGLSNDSEE
jgi:hypothetical protein